MGVNVENTDLGKLPEGTPDYMASAYFGCLMWAIRNTDMVAQFEKESGVKYPPEPKNAMEKMIDDATGVRADYFKRFKEWHDENVWGKIE